MHCINSLCCLGSLGAIHNRNGFDSGREGNWCWFHYTERHQIRRTAGRTGQGNTDKKHLVFHDLGFKETLYQGFKENDFQRLLVWSGAIIYRLEINRLTIRI
jgi:hypothetical protein